MSSKSASTFDKAVIVGEPSVFGRDPKSRKVTENQIILDPGSHPASVFGKASPDRPRDLAGMTHWEILRNFFEISL